MFHSIQLPGHPDLENVRLLDASVIPIVRRMHRVGTAIDIPYLEELGSQFRSQQAAIAADIEHDLPAGFLERVSTMGEDDEFNIDSPEQVAVLLFEELEVGKGRRLKTTGTGDRLSTGKKQLEMLRGEHDLIGKILEYREYAKLLNTYVEKLPKIAVSHPKGECPLCGNTHTQPTQRVHTEFTMTRTDTGRFSCVAAWTPIRTKRGTIPIWEAKIGDLVWTHRHRWRPITATWIKGVEQMYSFRLSNGHVLTCTKSHRLLTYKHEHFKTVGFGAGERGCGFEDVSVSRLSDLGSHCKTARCDLSLSTMDREQTSPARRETSTQGNQIFPLQEWRQKSDEGQIRATAPQLDWGVGRWTRVSDLIEEWQEEVLSPNCRGRGVGSGELARTILGSSYRRGPEEQQYRQLSNSNECGTPQVARTPEGHSICRVEEINPAGCHTVFDISVHEDESYETCGVFSHNSKNPNLQNIPSRTESGKLIRQAFIPEPGKALVDVDFSQIELRVLAHYSGDERMIDTYARDGDIHETTTRLVFNPPADKIKDKIYRVPAKTANFLVVYGGSEDALQASLAVAGIEWSRDDCIKFIDAFYQAYPAVRYYQAEQHYRARRYGLVWDLWGRVRLVPEVRSTHRQVVEAGLRQAGNMPIQSTSAGIMKISMAEVWEWLRGVPFHCEPLLTVHDQLLMEVDREYADDVLELIGLVMGGCVRLRVPVKAEGEVLERWK